ncbi:MAG: A/G-specific adenine glycosylase [Acinetobacter sp.]|nr:A/G-specific adenine glycosylase [Acinetobacter sp.]
MPHAFFTTTLLQWYDQYGRHDLPWQVKDNPYQVWVSEIMLQQTQVKTVLHYFPKFIERFPTVHDLAQADWEDVAPYWAGLGYYARARNLHKASRIVAQQGHFPQTVAEWQQLPGVGRSTAGALMSLGLRQYGVILDGNVKRVLARFFALDDDFSKAVNEKKLWQLAEQLCPQHRNADYTQAIMDFGATLCTPKKALCHLCPMQRHCQAFQYNLVEQLPFKKSKKAVPIKSADVIVIQHQNQYLWQQRPAQGLWGGLWCLPMIEYSSDHNTENEADNTQQHILQALVQSDTLQKQPCDVQLTHHFTHFTWQLNVQMFHMEHQNDLTSISPILHGEWLSMAQVQQKALPTAMKKLLHALTSSHAFTIKNGL